jgi:deoxyribonuclease V
LETQSFDVAEKTFFEQIQSLINANPIHHPERFSKICGVDAAYSAKDKRVVATAVLFLDGNRYETKTYEGTFTFSYVSGLFYLYEGPFVVAAIKKLETEPQLVCFDAQGIAHPRSKGLATICGMVLGISSIGIAKRALVGNSVLYKTGLDRLRYNNEDVGFVTKENKEKYWSPGYSISLQDLEEIISQHGRTILKTLEIAHDLSKRSIADLDKAT